MVCEISNTFFTLYEMPVVPSLLTYSTGSRIEILFAPFKILILSLLQSSNGELERKADMFFKRTIQPHKPVTKVDTASEALAVSMGEKAGIDMEYMQELSGKSEETLYQDLKGVIFFNPHYGYGNVVEPKYLIVSSRRYQCRLNDKKRYWNSRLRN